MESHALYSARMPPIFAARKLLARICYIRFPPGGDGALGVGVERPDFSATIGPRPWLTWFNVRPNNA